MKLFVISLAVALGMDALWGAPTFRMRPMDDVDVLLLDKNGRAVTRRFTVLDHEEGALGAMKRADEKFIRAAATAAVEMDRKTLKVVVDCPVPSGMAVEKPEKGSVFCGDCVEFFVRPSLESTAYYQYAANADGRSTAIRYASPDTRVEGWKSSAKISVQDVPGGFRVAFEVPVAEVFKAPLKPGDRFGMNCTRSGRTAGGASTWSAVGGQFDNIDAFGTVVYGGPEAYFARRFAALSARNAKTYLSPDMAEKVAKEVQAVQDVVAQHASDPAAFMGLEEMLENLDKTLLEIAIKGRPFILYRPDDPWGNSLEPSAATRPLTNIFIRAARNAKTTCAIAAANLRDVGFMGQLKFFEDTIPKEFYQRGIAMTNSVARRFTIRQGFPVFNRSGRKLFDPMMELPMTTLLRLAPRESAPIFLELDTHGFAAGRYRATLAVKRAVPGYSNESIPVEVEVVDIDLDEVAADKAGYDYVGTTFLNGRRPSPNIARFLVERGYNVLFVNAWWEMFPRTDKDGTWHITDLSMLDNHIEAALAGGLAKDRVKLWIYMGMEANHPWNAPRDHRKERYPFASAKWDEGIRYMVKTIADHVRKRYGIGSNRIYWYTVDEPSGEIDDPTYKSCISRAYHAAKVIKSANPAYLTMTDPLPKFLESDKINEVLPKLAEVYDVIELYRNALTAKKKKLVAAMPFREVWTYSILDKEVGPAKYRRDVWENLRDGYREISTYWHMTLSAGGDTFDSTDCHSPDRYTDWATLYVDFANDAALLSRRQLAADMGAEEARLVMVLRRRFAGDATKLRRITEIIEKAVKVGTMTAMDAAREQLLDLVDGLKR